MSTLRRTSTQRTEADDRVRVEQAAQIFWHQREAINEYLITGRPSVLQEVRREPRSETLILT